MNTKPENTYPENAYHPQFKIDAINILKRYNHLFVFVRYLSNKDFYFFESEEEFDTFLKSRQPGEALTLFKNNFKIIHKGILDEKNIARCKKIIQDEKAVDWGVIGIYDDQPQWSEWIADEEEFIEVMEDEPGCFLIIFEDQNWFDESITIHGYIPSSDGIVRLVAY